MSGGEYQKLVVARAFTKDGSIKIFDEPSSALDPIAEHDLYKNIMKEGGDNVMIFISHRLSSVVFCQALFPEKSVRIPCFRQGNFPAFGGAQLRIPTHEGMLHPVAFSLKD